MKTAEAYESEVDMPCTCPHSDRLKRSCVTCRTKIIADAMMDAFARGRAAGIEESDARGFARGVISAALVGRARDGGEGPDDAAEALTCACGAVGWRYCDGSVTWCKP